VNPGKPLTGAAYRIMQTMASAHEPIASAITTQFAEKAYQNPVKQA